MAFIPLNYLAVIENKKDTPKIATVINNNDPKNLQRIKVSLEGMFDPVDAKGSNLPWIMKMQDSQLCGNSCESYSVPEEGSSVEIIWPYDDTHAFYRGVPLGNSGSTKVFSGPNEWGWTDGSFTIKIDSSTGEFTIKNSGATIKGDAVGNITILGGNITIQGNTKIDGKMFLAHTHSNGHNGGNTGGVV